MPPPVMRPPASRFSRPEPIADHLVKRGVFDGADAESVSQARRFVVSQCKVWGIADDTRDDAEHVVSELAANAHAHSGSARFVVWAMVAMTVRGPGLYVEVQDSGRWRDQLAQLPTDEPVTGRGWVIVRALALDSGAVYIPGAGTTAWACLPSPDAHRPDGESTPSAPAA